MHTMSALLQLMQQVGAANHTRTTYEVLAQWMHFRVSRHMNTCKGHTCHLFENLRSFTIIMVSQNQILNPFVFDDWSSRSTPDSANSKASLFDSLFQELQTWGSKLGTKLNEVLSLSLAHFPH